MTIVNTMVDVLYTSVKQPIPRDWVPVMACEELSPIISTDSRIGFDFPNQNINGWLSLVRKELYSNPAVEGIFVTIEDNEVDIWVVIPEHDLAILHQIVEREGKLFETLFYGENPPFLVDFHIIYRRGRSLKELAPTKAISLLR